MKGRSLGPLSRPVNWSHMTRLKIAKSNFLQVIDEPVVLLIGYGHYCYFCRDMKRRVISGSLCVQISGGTK